MTILVSMRLESNQVGLHEQVEVRAHVLVDGTYLVGSDRIGGKHVPVHRHQGIEVQFLGKLEGFTHRHVADDATAVPEKVALVDRQHRGGNGQQPRSEEHTSELQSLMRISYAVFCLKQK